MGILITLLIYLMHIIINLTILNRFFDGLYSSGDLPISYQEKFLAHNYRNEIHLIRYVYPFV